MKALIDCNNFFVSCERAFQPELADKPVAVLSSNDGCIIARSNEVKDLGVPMGAPVFKFRDVLRRSKVEIRSSNFALYSDMSRRVVATLRQFDPDLEVYSIDESFLETGQLSDYAAWAQSLREQVLRHTGIPVSAGVAPTKTLAKIASTLAKEEGGVLSWAGLSNYELDSYLINLPVDKVWGVGRGLTRRLNQYQIRTAFGLKHMPDSLQQQFNVVVRRMVMELRGVDCMPRKIREHSDTIMSTRSFGNPVQDIKELGESLSMHAAQVGAKLRKQQAAAGGLVAFVSTGKHASQHYFRRSSVNFPVATADTRVLVEAAGKLLAEIYSDGYTYKRAGVIAYNILPKAAVQLSAFINPEDIKKGERMSEALDKVNRKWGRQALKLAAEGLRQDWQAKHVLRSPLYTTVWEELPSVG